MNGLAIIKHHPRCIKHALYPAGNYDLTSVCWTFCVVSDMDSMPNAQTFDGGGLHCGRQSCVYLQELAPIDLFMPIFDIPKPDNLLVVQLPTHFQIVDRLGPSPLEVTESYHSSRRSWCSSQTRFKSGGGGGNQINAGATVREI
ncbi:hypothetical protein BC936DRAFT_138396 [Jimgerdemannia flammicorona]|uniref:Uncharacterized protein n=1 Tax=Jimgerdemannia flammicorona TaxID=994334 RepID=A0A433CIQ4_9FUNG|nr:hypothetical protein BC936DRAFT_138396 [Jimgerdemannia flammicorona]